MSKTLTKGLFAWKEICEILGWKTTGGTYRNARKKELSTLCDWIMEGRKIRIKEVYEEKQTKLSSGKYVNDIQTLLLHILASNKDGVIETTIKNLMNLLDIVNDNYVNCYLNRKILSEKTKVDEDYIDEVYSILHSYKRTINNSLSSLERKRLITVSIYNKISYNMPVYKTDDNFTATKDVNGDNIIMRYEEDFRIPTQEEEQMILAIEEEEMIKLGVKDSLYFDINPYIGNKWRNNVTKRLKEYNINYMFKCYKIVYNPESIERRLKRTQEKEVRDRLNSNVLSQVIKVINSYHEKNIVDEHVNELIDMGLYTVEEIESDFNCNCFRKNDDYIGKCTKIAKRVIDRHIRTRDIIMIK